MKMSELLSLKAHPFILTLHTSTIFPPATTAMISASLIVLSLCAITNTVLPEIVQMNI